MAVHFHVLASGSSGNACVLDIGGAGILLDFGLSPKDLTPRMKRAGISWHNIRAAILTHMHTDHWQAATLSQLAKLRIPVFCHQAHLASFDQTTRAFAALSAENLLRHYEPGDRLALLQDCACTPIALPHDGTMTCGFRFEGTRGEPWAIGYAADMGSWKEQHVQHLADVDVLALEFNHDVPMQLASGRHPMLIRRVLGDEGHLSNEQAAELLIAIVRRSAPGRIKHVVQLHLSRECNRRELAEAAAQDAITRLGVELQIHTVEHGKRGPTIRVGGSMYTQPLLALEEAV